MKWLIGAAATAVLGAAVSPCSGATSAVDSICKSGTVHGQPVQIVVLVASDDCVASYGERIWGGDDEGPARLHVRDVRMSVGKRLVWFPMSAFGDLGQPSGVSIGTSGGGVAFTIKGGETATSYTARFVVVDGVLQRRRVELGEFPEVWEETKYSGPNRVAR